MKTYITEAIEERLGKGTTLRRLDASKERGARFRFGMKREEGVKILPAVLAVILVAGILSGLIIANVSSLFQTSSTISSVGTFKAIGIGVYWDDNSTSKVNTLDWGLLTPGATKSFTVYVSNEGVVPLTLSISASNWSPPGASNYLTLTWNYGGQAVTAGVTIPVTITLKVSTAITGINNFNFDITAVGTYGS